MNDLLIKAKRHITKIKLVDRFLIIFMLILLLYTAIGLFTGMTDSQSGDTIDTIVRTSSASIFGYFISTNFIKANAAHSITDPHINSPDLPMPANDENLSVQLSAQNGSASPADDAEGPVTDIPPNHTFCSKLQVTIVSSIGGCALILLFIIKFFIAETSGIPATVSQLRDFVSACIGFLISCGRAK